MMKILPWALHHIKLNVFAYKQGKQLIVGILIAITFHTVSIFRNKPER